MFQKDPASGKLSNPVIFDFQGTRYNCPALDVGNFMFTSMKPEARRAHLEELLRVYFNTFTDVANKLGYPVELTYNVTLYRHLLQSNLFKKVYIYILLSTYCLFALVCRNSMKYFVKKSSMDFGSPFGSLLKSDMRLLMMWTLVAMPG